MATDDDTLETYLAHRATLIDAAAPILGCRSRAEDVVQDAYLRLRDFARRTTPARPAAVLFRIVRNLAIDHARRLALEARLGLDAVPSEAVPANEPSPEAVAIDREALRIVGAALDELPAPVQRAFAMHRIGSHTYAGIAKALGLSESTVHLHIHQAMRHCRDRLRQAQR